MAQAQVTLPDGRSVRVSGKTREDVIKRIDALRSSSTPKETPSHGFEISDELPPMPDGPGTTFGDADISNYVAKTDIGQTISDAGKDAAALGELGLTMATGGAAEIITGFSGALNILLGRPVGEVRTSMDLWQDTLTYSPKTERGERVLHDIAIPLSNIEDGADKIAFSTSMGNPYAATMIKTALLGAVELLPAGRAPKDAISVSRKIKRQEQEIKRTANELGIQVDSENLATSIIESAQRMTPDERAQNAPMIRDAMIEAKNRARDEKNAIYDRASETRTYIKTGAIQDLNFEVNRELADRQFDLEEMPIVRKRLADLSETPLEGAVAIHLNEIEKVRKRINANRSQSPSENYALDTIKRNIDRYLDAEFNRSALDVGSNLIGDKDGIQIWKEARQAHRQWKQNFFEDKAIAQLIEMESTPEMYRQWLMGASAQNARKEAASTIRRMRSVLGENHPAIEGIRQDFLFEMAEPLLQENPNFNQFVTNYDRTMRRNPDLARELGLRDADLRQLVDFAKVQAKLPPVKARVQVTDFTKALAQFFVGHNIAKASLRVNMSRGIANMLFGVDRISKKQMLGELVGVKFGQPALPKKGPLAAQFIAGAAITGIQNETDE